MPTENLILQIAKKRDLSQIASIYNQEFSKPPYNEPWTNKIALEKLKKLRKYTDIWKIENEKEIIGFIIINTNWWFPKENCFIEELAIKEEHQQKEIGKTILTQIMKIYKEKGFKNFLLISKRKSKPFEFYKKLNFEESTDDVLMGISIKNL